MPELPEVEVITQGLRPLILGRSIESTWYSRKQLRFPFSLEKFRLLIEQQKIISVSRRAKYIQILMESGSLLVIHLGMTGQMGVFKQHEPRAKHDHLEWTMDNDMALRYNDIRRFGSIHLFSADEAKGLTHSLYRNIGPEPFDKTFSAKYLHKLSHNKKTSIKQFLMNNQVVAGIGNIYANESLFDAGIRPSRKVDTLSMANFKRIILSTRQVLSHAIKCGGSTISDFVNASQQKGYFQMNFMVYGRDGQQCKQCAEMIKKKKIGGRATFYCSFCQK